MGHSACYDERDFVFSFLQRFRNFARYCGGGHSSSVEQLHNQQWFGDIYDSACQWRGFDLVGLLRLSMSI
jgi:hypothetical protein